MFQSINPATGQVINQFKSLDNSQLEQKLQESGSAYQKWSTLSIDQRIESLKPVKKELIDNVESYAQMIHEEMGKTLSEAQMEVRKCATLFDSLFEHAPKWLSDENLESDGIKHFARYEPLGTIFGIMPWNYPFWQVLRFAVPTLIAGNTICIKHAPNVFGCSELIESLFKKHLPESVYQNLIITHEQSEQVIASPSVQGVSLTGSDRAGSQVMQTAGKYLKKVVLELGGSDPFIVFEDANIKKAVRHATIGRLLTSGQTCIAAKRIFVHEDVFDSFYEQLVESFESYEIGPLVHESALHVANSYINDARVKGATIIQSSQNGNGCYLPPTIMTNISSEMLVSSNEIFAPIACLYKFTDENKVIEQANSTQYGLGGAIFTNDKNKALRVANRLDCGTVFINSFTKSDPLVPFGGIKRSGIGREIGKLGIREFTNYKVYNFYRS